MHACMYDPVVVYIKSHVRHAVNGVEPYKALLRFEVHAYRCITRKLKYFELNRGMV